MGGDSLSDRRSLTRFILRGGTIVVAARLVVLIAGFAIQVLLARLLPPAELGAYFLTQSVISTLAVFGQLGLSRPLTRELGRLVGRHELSQARSLLMLGLRLSIAPVVVVSVAYAAGLGVWLAEVIFSSPTMAAASVAAAAWLAGTAFQNLGSAAVRGFHKVGTAAFLGGAVTNVVVVVLLVLWVWSDRSTDLVEVVWITTIGTWLNIALCIAVLGRRVRGVVGEPVVSSRDLMTAAVPLIGAQVMSMGFTQADLWIVGGLLSDNDVALYGAAKRIARLVGVPIVTLGLVVPPIIADLHAKGEMERLERLLRGSATLAGIPAILAAVPCLLAGGVLLEVLFGAFFADAQIVLQLLCIERLAAVIVGPCMVVLTMSGHERDVFRIVAIAGVLSLGAICVGGWLGGKTGVATAYAISGLLRESYTWWFVRQRLGVRTDVDVAHLGAMRDAAERAFQRGSKRE